MTAATRRTAEPRDRRPVAVGEPAIAVVSPARPESGRRNEQNRPPLLVVPPRARRRRVGALAVLFGVTVFAVMLGLTAFQTKIAQDQGRVDRLERETRLVQLQFEKLRLEVARLQAPEHIVAEAKARGMVTPDQVTYVVPSPEAVAAVTAAGAAASPGGRDGSATSSWAALKPIVEGAP
jgi:cell division protein FtsL